MLGWSTTLGSHWSRTIGVRAGPECRRRADSRIRYDWPYEPKFNVEDYYELGARLEAYGDLVRYKRIFLRARVAYNLFSIANPQKHPNQAEASLNLGISLGKRR
jgi:hypothetical protein